MSTTNLEHALADCIDLKAFADRQRRIAGTIRVMVEEIQTLRTGKADIETALRDLVKCEEAYRKVHDTKGEGHMDVGRAWDKMRHAGDRARVILGVDAKLEPFQCASQPKCRAKESGHE